MINIQAPPTSRYQPSKLKMMSWAGRQLMMSIYLFFPKERRATILRVIVRETVKH